MFPNNHIHSDRFQYLSHNPYRHRLNEFDEFVLQDCQGEAFKGTWKNSIFKNDHPLWVEIGCGNGEFLMDLLKTHPVTNLVGIDIRFKRAYQTAKKISLLPTQTLKLLRANAERLEYLFAPKEVDAFFYFFPDPWQKKRHQKKRLFRTENLSLFHQLLAPEGLFYIKTDHDEYFEWMLTILENQPYFSIEFLSKDLYGTSDSPENLLTMTQTQFERLFKRQGKIIKALILRARKLS